MKIKIVRQWFTDNSTVGKWFWDNDSASSYYTLEDVVRELGVKVPGKTAIPKGVYEVRVTFSNRFQKPLPLLLNVPMFEGIRIHPGNTAADTEGCILVGMEKAPDTVSRSREAFDLVFGKIQAALKVEKVFLEIT